MVSGRAGKAAEAHSDGTAFSEKIIYRPNHVSTRCNFRLNDAGTNVCRKVPIFFVGHMGHNDFYRPMVALSAKRPAVVACFGPGQGRFKIGCTACRSDDAEPNGGSGSGRATPGSNLISGSGSDSNAGVGVGVPLPSP